MLKEEVGEVLQQESISDQSIAARLQYGYAPFTLFNTLFDIAIKDMQYEYVNLDELSTEAQYIEPDIALKNSFLFRMVDTIDTTAEINISKRLLPKKVQLDAENYINKFCNKHFKYRKMQLDCEYILKAISSELCIFADSNNIQTNLLYDSTINLRSITKQKSSSICNEITALKRIKELFVFIFKNINNMLYELECIAYKLRNKPIVNNITTDIDL